MAVILNRLTARKVATIKAPGRHADGGGLYLVVGEKGSRSWVFLYRRAKKMNEVGLGSAVDVTLAEAREKAATFRRLVGEGGDPLAAKREREAKAAALRAEATFGEVADSFIELNKPSWKNDKHAGQWEVTVGDRPAKRPAATAKALRDLPVARITTADVLKILSPIWHLKPETAKRVRGRIEAVLDAASARGLRTGENPARWRGHLDKLLPKPKKLSRGHHAAMPFEDVPALIAGLRAVGAVSSIALEFTILTASRTSEVRGARWGEFDLDAHVWTVPAERMKSGRPHRVPLSPRAVAILETMASAKSATGLVFPNPRTGRELSVMALAMELRRRSDEHVTVHGFRSSFRDWAGEKTHFAREVAEAALAHVVGDETERAYRRGDALEKRRRLMDAWAEYCEPEKDRTVVWLSS